MGNDNIYVSMYRIELLEEDLKFVPITTAAGKAVAEGQPLGSREGVMRVMSSLPPTASGPCPHIFLLQPQASCSHLLGIPIIHPLHSPKWENVVHCGKCSLTIKPDT